MAVFWVVVLRGILVVWQFVSEELTASISIEGFNGTAPAFA
jgi:hypothetical protein